jgi:hypothetical protein
MTIVDINGFWRGTEVFGDTGAEEAGEDHDEE